MTGSHTGDEDERALTEPLQAQEMSSAQASNRTRATLPDVIGDDDELYDAVTREIDNPLRALATESP